ncbi:MAG: clostripain-related cysteine peptidase [Candidatus Babeliales bacterium]
MNQRIFSFVNIYLFFVASLICADNKPWTFLVYIAGDNNLAKYADLDLKEMMEIGSNEYVNIIAYTTVKRENEEKKTIKYYVEKDNLVPIGDVTVKDSGDVATFIEALEWAHTDYPSEHFAVVLWDHGSGPLNRRPSAIKGICFDDTTHHYLTDRDCFAAFGWICDKFRGGKKIDLVACDACLMGSLEVAYTFARYADYYVASEDTIPGHGYQYALTLAPFKSGAPQPIDLAKHMVKAYAECYKKTNQEYTLSAIDLKQLDAVVNKLNLFSQFYSKELKKRDKAIIREGLVTTLQKGVCLPFGGESYIDLYQWLNTVFTNINTINLDIKSRIYLQDLIRSTLPLISKAVIANSVSQKYRDAKGLTIYLPLYRIEYSYEKLLWSEWTKWLGFLEAFMAA